MIHRCSFRPEKSLSHAEFGVYGGCSICVAASVGCPFGSDEVDSQNGGGRNLHPVKVPSQYGGLAHKVSVRGSGQPLIRAGSCFQSENCVQLVFCVGGGRNFI